jgi:hypothetical protein
MKQAKLLRRVIAPGIPRIPISKRKFADVWLLVGAGLITPNANGSADARPPLSRLQVLKVG